jgi:lysyl-tRNA synthetase class 2
MSLPVSILEDNDQTRARREHLEGIRALVGNAYPNKFARTNVAGSSEGEDTITSIVNAFKRHEPRVEEEGARPAPEQLEEANGVLNEVTVRLSGRLATPPRVMGKVAFVHLSDGEERLQIYVRRQEARATDNDAGASLEEPEAGWKLFQLLDHGDFIGVEGHLFVTKTGELSVHVNELTFLAKALTPMPDKLHGINDPEIRQRQRYADLVASSLKIQDETKEGGTRELTTREVFMRRSRMITEMRRYLDAHGYVEVETPMLSPIASGAAARPFKTHHNALGIDLYARIAPELYLKRLLVGGFERVYELNRNFRNEGLGYRWNPEFTMLEFYCAYMDVNGMMDFCEEMLRETIWSATHQTEFTITENFRYLTGIKKGQFRPHNITFSSFRRLTMKEAISINFRSGLESHSDIHFSYIVMDGESFKPSWLDDPQKVRILSKFINGDYRDEAEQIIEDEYKLDPDNDEELVEIREWELAVADFKGLSDIPSDEETARHIVFLFEKLAEASLINPTFITDFPKPVSPLSKASPENPAIAERFELYINGMEIANGFSELNDPVEQYERFQEQAKQRERGDDEAMAMDEDYVRALAYGMPPAAGIGIGIDRLAMLLTNKRSIRDVILFPHMRPRAASSPGAEEAGAQEPSAGEE